MSLRNAGYTITIEVSQAAGEAKRDGLVALVADLTLREVITPALRRKRYYTIECDPSTGGFGPFTRPDHAGFLRQETSGSSPAAARLQSRR
jgi:hypothetical protein